MTETEVPTLQKKLWKKRTVGIALTLFISIPFIAFWAGMKNVDSVAFLDFLFFFSLAMYGRITGKLEARDSTENPHKKWANTPGHDEWGYYVGYRN